MLQFSTMPRYKFNILRFQSRPNIQGHWGRIWHLPFVCTNSSKGFIYFFRWQFLYSELTFLVKLLHFGSMAFWYCCFQQVRALSRKITWTHCFSIPRLFSIPSIACFTRSAVWDLRKCWACKVARCKLKLESTRCAVKLSSDIGQTDDVRFFCLPPTSACQ